MLGEWNKVNAEGDQSGNRPEIFMEKRRWSKARPFFGFEQPPIMGRFYTIKNKHTEGHIHTRNK